MEEAGPRDRGGGAVATFFALAAVDLAAVAVAVDSTATGAATMESVRAL